MSITAGIVTAWGTSPRLYFDLKLFFLHDPAVEKEKYFRETRQDGW